MHDYVKGATRAPMRETRQQAVKMGVGVAEEVGASIRASRGVRGQGAKRLKGQHTTSQTATQGKACRLCFVPLTMNPTFFECMTIESHN
jgi:hypothetical protein